MSTATIALLLLASGSIILWYMIFIVLPRLFVSIYRYNLWEIRDQLWDCVWKKELPNNDFVEYVIYSIEYSIKNASENNLLTQIVSTAIGKSAPNDKEQREFDEFVRVGEASLSERERELLFKAWNRVVSFQKLHCFLGSPSGWIFFLICLPISVVIFAYKVVCKKIRASIFDPATSIIEGAIGEKLPEDYLKYPLMRNNGKADLGSLAAYAR